LKRKFAALLSVLLSCTVAFAFQQPGPVGPVGPPQWEKFSSPEGRFRVQMPVAPKASSREVDTPAGKLMLYVYDLSNDLGYFTATYADYPIAPRDFAHAEEVLDSVRDGVLSGVKGQLTSEKKITVRTHPGREFTASSKVQDVDLVFTWRIYLVGRRLYQLAVATNSKNAGHPDIAKFLTSFDLITNQSASR
jgi:hypothetical protein